MRFALPTLLLIATVTPAAPVPDTLKIDNARLESLWGALLDSTPVGYASAVYVLLDQPGGVEFLIKRLPPVGGTSDQLKGWLKALNSTDEKVWKPALAELQYHDPRAGLTVAEQLERVNTDEGKRRLIRLWSPSVMDETARQVKVTVKGPLVLCEWYTGENGLSCQIRLQSAAERDDPAWNRAALAAHVLYRLDNKASREALTRLAGGHADALPTRTAAELLRAQPPKATAAFTDAHWGHLVDGDSGQLVEAVFALRQAKNLPQVLKPKLPPITASKEQLTTWLKALNDADPKVWKPAFTELCYFRPTLALTLTEQCELMTNDRGRSLLFQFWWIDYDTAPRSGVLRPDCTLTATATGLTARHTPIQREVTADAPVEALKAESCGVWQRARLAIRALERDKSDEAKAVLKQLADGHPDILPTKEAKAALERLK
jgi:hypothetical protein